jgi:serine/threonine protein kinase
VAQHTVLAGRYTLVSPLGRGGMGQVWEGRDERLGRPVAVKLLTGLTAAGRAHRDDLVRRFTREAAVTAGLAHPGVPAIYDAGEYDGGLFLVMELVVGCTISDLIAEQGPLPVPWAAAIGAQVAAVLVLAHERGIIHRDIKPQNIMLTGDGAAKVLDFGVAGLLNQHITSTGLTVGTPGYMAPEQLHGLPATPRTDLYTLGCLLYEMLSGGPVFAAATAAGLMHQHLAQAPAPISRADVPPWLAGLVGQLLEKDPARRPANARETCDRLLPYVQPAGRLGDINPAADSRSSMQLYALLLARLRGAGPEPGWNAPAPWAGGFQQAPPGGFQSQGPWGFQSPGPSGLQSRGPGGYQRPGPGGLQSSGPPPGPSAGQPPGTRDGPGLPGPGWKLRHSLWMLPTVLFGLATWVSFGYIGARHQRRSWLIAAAVYLILDVLVFVLLALTPFSGPGIDWGLDGTFLLLALWPAGIIHALAVNFGTRLPLLADKGTGRLPAGGRDRAASLAARPGGR